MAVVHVIAEIVVLFAAISLIYYFFQITQAHGSRRQNLIYLGISLAVLLVAYPLSNLVAQKQVDPTDQVSKHVRKIRDKERPASSDRKPADSSAKSESK
ncbi:hypothetical protein [Levilactobacillus yonginensis]|uniref:hypothetical protein n=1 Tax=Levilactobacillus yonginensis TaxID=1054041 RepID=UPI00345CB8F8